MNIAATGEGGPQNTTHTEWRGDALPPHNHVTTLLWQTWAPCLLLLGGFGNIATVFVMRRIKDNNSSQHVFLTALAMSDFCSLYVGVFRQWLCYAFQVDIYELHVVVCKVCWWLIYGASTTSSWLLTCVTVQRTMAVKWPHRMRVVCTLQRTRVVIGAVVTFGCTLHAHFLFGMVMSSDSTCSFVSAGYEDFITRVWAWVDLAVFTLLPSLCLMVCNVVLSFTLYQATSTTSMAMTMPCAATSGNGTRRKMASKTTVMILALSCTFLVLTMPVCVYLIWDYNAYDPMAQNTRLWTTEASPFAVTMLLWYTNSSVNFLLYCFTGTKFRTEFLNWIRCGTKVQANSTDSSSLSQGSCRKRN